MQDYWFTILAYFSTTIVASSIANFCSITVGADVVLSYAKNSTSRLHVQGSLIQKKADPLMYGKITAICQQ
jgi:hypothetical protein